MYEILKLGLAVVVAVLGLFMAIFPKLSTKKEKRDDKKAVSTVRTSGIVLTICGIGLFCLFKFL